MRRTARRVRRARLNSGNITTTGVDEIVFGAYGEYSSSTTNNELIGGLAADQVVRASLRVDVEQSLLRPVHGRGDGER